MAFSKINKRNKIRRRIRGKISGNSEAPRLSVFKSNKQIYVQLIDDLSGSTLMSVSSAELKDAQGVTKMEQAQKVGAMVAEKAKAANISSVKFDRSGYVYHGRIKALGDAAREGGLKF